MVNGPAETVLQELSREFAMTVDTSGVITWLDARGLALLKAKPGTRLEALAAIGTESKVSRLLAEVQSGSTAVWELVLCVDDSPCTLAFRGRMMDGRIVLLGSFVSEDYAVALDQISSTLSEMSALHRETDRQQRELLQRHQELLRLHQDLGESRKGVLALHAEIDDKDDSLRRAGEVKARLLANVSHEFRTPLNAIIGLAQILLDRVDGELNEEQDKQLGFIKQSAQSLYELVNDVLDLSKLEAGKVSLRAEKFLATDMFSALRGMLAPLVANQSVQLVFEDVEPELELETDEGKVSQILRNLISNAVKFTENGQVTISAAASANGSVAFKVTDTGIGIAPADQTRVFEEFTQIDSPLQKRAKGTGLGLPLSRHLAERLGGTLTVESKLGQGSTFELRIPRRHPEVAEMVALVERSTNIDPGRSPILVIEDDRQTLFLYEKYLRGSGFQVVPARSLEEARTAMKKVRPAAVVLDIMLDGEASWSFLDDLKSNPATRDIPALVVTVTNREEKARALGADEFFMKPMDRDWLLGKLRALAKRQQVETILVIDDDRVSRYLVRKHLEGLPYEVIEAAGGIEGVRLARERNPHIIFLDFVMPEMSAFDVLDELKRDPSTRNIPVIVHTSKNLAEEERRRLELEAAAILSKQSLSREIAIARIREALEKHGVSARIGGA